MEGFFNRARSLMRSPHQQRELEKELARAVPRERTFAELFPWRNLVRAFLLIVLILAIVAIKKSAAPLLSRMGELAGGQVGGPGEPAPRPAPAAAPPEMNQPMKPR